MPIVNARNTSKPNLLDFMSDKPYMRKELLEQLWQSGSRIEQLGQEYNNDQIEKLGFQMKTSLQFYQQNVGNNYGLILELDADGNILGSLHSTNGINSFISEALEGESDSPQERVLYIGSFGYPHILRLAIRKPASEIANSLGASGSSIGAQTIVSFNEPAASFASMFGMKANPSRSQYSPVAPSASSSSLVPSFVNSSASSPLHHWNHLRIPFIRHK